MPLGRRRHVLAVSEFLHPPVPVITTLTVLLRRVQESPSRGYLLPLSPSISRPQASRGPLDGTFLAAGCQISRILDGPSACSRTWFECGRDCIVVLQPPTGRRACGVPWTGKLISSKSSEPSRLRLRKLDLRVVERRVTPNLNTSPECVLPLRGEATAVARHSWRIGGGTAAIRRRSLAPASLAIKSCEHVLSDAACLTHHKKCEVCADASRKCPAVASSLKASERIRLFGDLP